MPEPTISLGQLVDIGAQLGALNAEQMAVVLPIAVDEIAVDEDGSLIAKDPQEVIARFVASLGG